MTSNPPTGEPEQQWQQPNFDAPRDEQFVQPVTGHVIVPGVGVMTETIPPSTKTLSVKKMNDYLNEVEAIATTELGVVFSDNRSWEDFFDGVTI